MLRCLALIIAVLAIAAPALADPAPIRLDSGSVQGVTVDDGDVAYKGLPYAAPPVGALRWKPPQPASAWTGVRQAVAFAPICPQAPSFALPRGATQSEDCLYLNVWSPNPEDLRQQGGKRPVMVWLHGGGDESGTASQPQFDGQPFASNGIIFVSVDYRLGSLGWFAHPALTAEAGSSAPLVNYGLMDQIAALKWVKRNIAAFGGDPAQVTLAGESSGGESVLALMTIPAAHGLFERAIVESGSGWEAYPSLKEAEAHGLEVATRAGAPVNADAATLRALPVAALLAADQGEAGMARDGRLLAVSPAQAFAAGQGAPMPLLIGSNSGEDSLLGRSDPAAVLTHYSAPDLAALRAAYGAETPDDASLGRALWRDGFMGAPARWFAARQSAKAPTFLYQFAYVPEAIRDRRPTASHGFEMLFVFEALARAPIPLSVSDRDKFEMIGMNQCWVTFVALATPQPFCFDWPAYSPAADQLMLFGPEGPDGAHVVAGFRKDPYDLLDAVEGRALTAGAGR